MPAPPARPAPRAQPTRILLPPQLALDESPRRSVTAVNVRRDDKVLFDTLQAWWSVEQGRALPQWEVFTLLLVAALENPSVDLPDAVVARMSSPSA